MENSELNPEYAFLMDDNEFVKMTKDLTRRHELIERHTEIIDLHKYKIDKIVIDVAKRLLADAKATNFYAEQYGEVKIHSQIKEYHLKNIAGSSMQISYDTSDGAKATVYVNEYDSYDGVEGSLVIAFPLSFIHRADWVAKLQIETEAYKLRDIRIEQEKKDKLEKSTRDKELETLQILMEKYKGIVK